jgi:hypothetical protein
MGSDSDMIIALGGYENMNIKKAIIEQKPAFLVACDGHLFACKHTKNGGVMLTNEHGCQTAMNSFEHVVDILIDEDYRAN